MIVYHLFVRFYTSKPNYYVYNENVIFSCTCSNIIILFQNLCGTESHPVKFRAKKYKIEEKSFSLANFTQMMTHLPEPVTDQEIMEMFNYADKDRDGRINFEEFLVIFIIFVADYIFSL